MKLSRSTLATLLLFAVSCQVASVREPSAATAGGATVSSDAAEVAKLEEEPSPLDAALFQRYVILGSSASAGFNIQLDTGVPTRLADYFEAGLLIDSSLASDGSTEMTFLDPEGFAGKAVNKALTTEPTLVIAVDFLFWFFYGSGGPGNTLTFRRERLEAGLALLAKFDCPVLVGDLPNMAGAAGRMIPYSSMPPADSFAAANARILEWAGAKENVIVVPLAEFNETVGSGGTFKVGEFTWEPAVMGDLLQADRLHPNLAGCAVMALQIMHSLASSKGATLDGVITTNPEDLADAVDDLVTSR
jgi:lysophospholipase L1-like esterase